MIWYRDYFLSQKIYFNFSDARWIPFSTPEIHEKWAGKRGVASRREFRKRRGIPAKNSEIGNGIEEKRARISREEGWIGENPEEAHEGNGFWSSTGRREAEVEGGAEGDQREGTEIDDRVQWAGRGEHWTSEDCGESEGQSGGVWESEDW